MREIDDEGFAIRPNKSQLKREQAAIRELVLALVEAGEGTWQALELDDALVEGLALARRMKASGARNRQIKYLARLLQQEGLERAQGWLAERDRRQAEARRHFQRLEQWRDRLVEEGDVALSAFLECHPQGDRQQLRQAVRAARREREQGKPVGAGKKLFRLLREIDALSGTL